MKKIFAINLKSVEYLGDAIGDDIFIEIKFADQIFKLDQKIKHKIKTEINKEITYFETEENILELPLNIKITEDDALFDDVGSKQGVLKIDLSKSLPQNQNFEVLVNEKRGLSGKRIAKFQVILEAVVPVRYVEDVDDHGWLIVFMDNRKEEPIPIYLKVQLHNKDDNREYFTILEGIRKNNKASVLLKKDGSSRFTKVNHHQKSVNLTYSISKKILKFGKQSYKTTDYNNAPWIKGLYNIRMPDYPHGNPNSHLNVKHFTTWFLVDFEEARYIHTGAVSLGCITLIEKERYEEIYQVLIRTRKGDNLNVGTLKVVD